MSIKNDQATLYCYHPASIHKVKVVMTTKFNESYPRYTMSCYYPSSQQGANDVINQCEKLRMILCWYRCCKQCFRNAIMLHMLVWVLITKGSYSRVSNYTVQVVVPQQSRNWIRVQTIGTVELKFIQPHSRLIVVEIGTILWTAVLSLQIVAMQHTHVFTATWPPLAKWLW